MRLAGSPYTVYPFISFLFFNDTISEEKEWVKDGGQNVLLASSAQCRVVPMVSHKVEGRHFMPIFFLYFLRGKEQLTK